MEIKEIFTQTSM